MDYVATNEARTHSYDQCMNAILAGIKEVEELRAEEVRIREEERQLAEGKAARGSAGEGNISEQGIMEKEGAGKQEDKGKNVARTPKTKTKIETVVEGLYRLIAPSPPELMEESDSDDDEIPPAQANHAPNSSIDVSRPPPRKPPHGHWSPVHKTGASQPVLINGLRVSLYDQRPADANEGGLTRVRSEAEMAELYTRFKEKGEVLNDFHYHRPFAHLFNTISTCVPNEYLDSLLSSRPFHPRYRSTLDEALVASATDDKVYQFVYVYGLEMDDATARRFIKSTKEGPFLTEMAKERKGTSARAWVAGVELEIEMAKAEGRVVRIVSYTGWAAGGLDALNIQARPNDHLHGKPHSLFTHILALVRQDAYLVSNSLLRLSLVAKFDSLDQLSVSSKMAGEQVICVMIGSSTLEGGANVNGTGDGNPLIASLDYLRAQAPSLHLDQLPSPSSLRNMVLDWAESWRLRDPTVRMGTVDDFLRFWSAREMEKAAERKEVGKKSVAQLAGIERRARMREEEKQRTKKEREMYGGPSYERLEVVSRRLSFAPDSCICPICSKDCLNTNAIRLHVAGCSDTHLADGYVNSLARSSNLDPFVCLDARCKAKGQLGKWKATVDVWPEAQLEEAAARPRAELEGLIVHVQAHFRAGSWEKACPVESCGFEGSGVGELRIHVERDHRLPLRGGTSKGFVTLQLRCKFCQDLHFLPGEQERHFQLIHASALEEQLKKPAGYAIIVDDTPGRGEVAEQVGVCPFCLSRFEHFYTFLHHVAGHIVALRLEHPNLDLATWHTKLYDCPAPCCHKRISLTPVQLVRHLVVAHKIGILRKRSTDWDSTVWSQITMHHRHEKLLRTRGELNA